MEVEKFTLNQKNTKNTFKNSDNDHHILLQQRNYLQRIPSICSNSYCRILLDVLRSLIVRFRRTEYRDPKSLSLLHDNARSYNTIIVRRFLARNQACLLNHPVLVPTCNFSLFPILKMQLIGCCSQTH